MCVRAYRVPSVRVFSTARSCDLAAIFSALNLDKQYPERERWMDRWKDNYIVFSLSVFLHGVKSASGMLGCVSKDY